MFLEVKREGEVAVPVKPWRRLLLDAADYIDQHGWCQDVWEDADGRVCVYWAMRRANRYTESVQDVARGKMEGFLGQELTSWNDAEGRTRDYVTTALRSCAVAGKGSDTLCS